MTGQRLLHYEIEERLGEGGMGVVYKARDSHLDRPVAIKVLPPDSRLDPDRRQRFVREAKAASTLNHPNIVTVYDAGEVDGVTFIVMEFVHGRTLAQSIPATGLPLCEALQYAAQIADGLGAAHHAGIVHRDLKPANILLGEDGRVRIVDFGLAKQTRIAHGEQVETETLTDGHAATKEGMIVGTISYMSPEQVEGRAVDARSDVFSLGAVLYEMLTGHRAFQGDSEISTLSAILRDTPPPVRGTRHDVPGEIEKIVGRCLAKPPGSRYATAAEAAADLRKVQGRLAGTVSLGWLRRRRIAIPLALGLTLAAAGGGLLLHRWWMKRWAENAILEVERKLASGWTREDITRGGEEMYRIVEKIQKHHPTHPAVPRLLASCSAVVKIETEPAGAAVSIQPYAGHAGWRPLGRTPIQDLRLPGGIYVWKFEKEGYETEEAAFSASRAPVRRVLEPVGSRPPGMVRIPNQRLPIGDLDSFYIDRCEVTNRQYKEFVDAGGYRKPDYWKQAFLLDGRSLTWEEAMARFRDRTGRPGPATWESGDYPAGLADYPVAGVSWYEAVAYAEFAGKSLPTVRHWRAGAGYFVPANESTMFLTLLRDASSLSGPGLRPVGQRRAMDTYGCLDMAGNAREWCWNESENGRSILGGAWTDAPYMYRSLAQLPAWDRSPENGFRCARYIDPAKIPKNAFERIEPPGRRDFRKEQPAPDAIFQVYREQFDYDPAPLQAAVTAREASERDYVREQVSYSATYDGDTIVAILLLPRIAKPPFQTVIYFPTSLAVGERPLTTKEYEFRFLVPIVKSGRAVMYPVYWGTYQRTGIMDIPRHGPGKLHQRAYTGFLIKWVKDFRRSIDYLESRPDIDRNRLAYLGYSWGAKLGLVVPAVEPRLKANVLVVGGYGTGVPRPEADAVNYTPRIRIPTLMLNGKYDLRFPYDTAVQPAFDHLGTPKADKRLVLYDTDHLVPMQDYIRETLGWLDRYLGPVR